jgi:hypothetical protein
MVQTNLKHWKPFGCPVYVLHNRLQGSGGIFHKWKHRSKVGIYLGRSPQHARSVALVLSRNSSGQPTVSHKLRPEFPHGKTRRFRFKMAIESRIRSSEGAYGQEETSTNRNSASANHEQCALECAARGSGASSRSEAATQGAEYRPRWITKYHAAASQDGSVQ